MKGNESATPPRLYLPALDGLRFFAFLAVFLHHLPIPTTAPHGLWVMHEFGWIGVELFFVISAYLFFHLLRAEEAKTGRIAVSHFFLRRFLRIYPLLIAFPLLAWWLEPGQTSVFLAGYLRLLTGVENIFVAWRSWDFSIPHGLHLWTITYELQIYLFIPAVFFLFRRVGRRNFALCLGGIWLLAVAGRCGVIHAAWAHPFIYMLPPLRPESVLIGLFLATGRLELGWPAVSVAGLGALALVVSGPNVTITGYHLLYLYPLCALFCGSLLWLSLHTRAMGSFLQLGVLRYLGRISYGLYVYQNLAMLYAYKVADALHIYPLGRPLAAAGQIGVLTLLFNIVVASLSYYLLERPFLRLKRKITAVDSRPI